MRDRNLALDCAQHARLFFGSADLRLEVAAHESFTLTPSDVIRDALARDYDAMGGMIFEPPPPINNVFQAIADLKQHLNTDSTN